MSDMKLQMIVSGNNSGLNQVLQQSDRNVRNFTQGAAGHFTRLQAHAGRVWQSINGMSAATKLIGIGGGALGLKAIIDANLEFEKTLLEMKQLAGMTMGQSLEMRAAAISQAGNLLKSPLEIAEGMKVLANAGMKFEAIAGTIAEAGRAALLFRSSITDVANMDFDIQTKFKIDPSEMKKAHEVLYYHSKDGRFEAKSLSQYAPEYLNAFKNVGIGGMGGLNFVGAITQVVQQAAPATQPGEVATMIKQGLSHIYSDHVGKKLKEETGINIEKYAFQNGKFYGKDGVPGMLDLATAMKAAGLDNDFKLQKAGFREQESRTFWRQLMNNAAVIREKMSSADDGAAANVGDQDVKEIKAANFGKIKAAEIEIEKFKVSGGALAVTGGAGSAASLFSEHPIATTAAAVGATLAGKYLLSKLMGGKGGGLGQLGAGASGVVPVFVTNWPGGPEKASARMQRLATTAAGGGGAGTAVAAAGGGALVSAAVGVGIVATPAVIAYAAKKYFDSNTGQAARAKGLTLEIERLQARVNAQKGPGYQDKDQITKLEGQVKQMTVDRDGILSRLDALANRPVEVHIDGHKVAETVNKVNGRDARRQ